MLKILSLTLLSVLAMGANAADLPDFPHVAVNGKASVDLPPDKATVSFTITEFNQNSESAMSAVMARGSKIIATAKEFNIPISAVSSFNVDKRIIRARNSDYRSLEILGYEISQSFNILIEDISLYSDFTDRVVTMPNVANVSANFDISKRKAALEKLSIAAGVDARSRANHLVKGLDVRLGAVFSISEFSHREGREAIFEADSQRLMRFSGNEIGPQDSFNLFVPKTINLSKTVKVIFAIAPDQ